MDEPSSPPKTPTNVQRIPRDESFKTCKAEVASPSTRQRLRMTPIRTSILSGGKPFKEAKNSNSKSFRSRRKTLKTSEEDSVGSNETFIRCEQEFDRDSLDKPRPSLTRLRGPSIPKPPPLSPITAPEDPSQTRFSSTPKKVSPEKKVKQVKESCTFKKESPKKVVKKPLKSQEQPSVSYKRMSPKRAPRPLPPPFGSSRPRFSSSKASMPPPPPRFPFPTVEKRKMTANQNSSRYLTSTNKSRLTRSLSYKSTAELEKEFINSLRSF